MTERPILFTGEMVRAILDGRKTQTRRPVKLPKSVRERWSLAGMDDVLGARADQHARLEILVPDQYSRSPFWAYGPRCPCGKPGDRLWVRETWRFGGAGIGALTESVHYRADLDEPPAAGCWKPSIHMPRWASRLTLEVTEVRVERLRSLSEDDAHAEGLRYREAGLNRWGDRRPGWSWRDPHPVDVDPEGGWQRCLGTAQNGFGNLWNASYGHKPELDWAHNPWVWVVSFRGPSAGRTTHPGGIIMEAAGVEVSAGLRKPGQTGRTVSGAAAEAPPEVPRMQGAQAKCGSRPAESGGE